MANRPALKRFVARYILRTGKEIDDILQESFLRAYEAEKKRKIEEPKAFLFRVTKNLILSDFEKHSAKVTDYLEDLTETQIDEKAGQTQSLEDSVTAQRALGQFCEVVASLPTQCRRVFVMKRVYGYSQKEIARELGIAESTVEKHLIKGMRDCRRLLTERYGEDPVAKPTSIDTRPKGNQHT